MIGDNVVVTATAGQLILAAASYGTSSDQGTLHPSRQAAQATLDAAGVAHRFHVNLADAAFASAKAFATPTEGTCLVAVPRTGGAGAQRVPAGQERMAARLATPPSAHTSTAAAR